MCGFYYILPFVRYVRISVPEEEKRVYSIHILWTVYCGVWLL